MPGGDFRDKTVSRASRGRFLSIRQASEIAGVPPGRIYAWIRSGRLPAIKIGGRGVWRIEAERLATALGIDDPPQDQAGPEPRE